MISKKQEERAVKLVTREIERALAKMRRYVDRALQAGEEPDLAMMRTIVRGIAALADEYAIDITSGEYGDMIEKAMKAGAKDAAAVAVGTVAVKASITDSLVIGKDEVEAVLLRSYTKIKGILADGEKIVAEEVLKSVVGGASQRDVAEAIGNRLQVVGKDGELGDIAEWRAELIARNELSASYRTAKQQANEAAGFRYYVMTGPNDDRTAGDVCAKYLNQIHTVEEWEAIGDKEGADDLMTYGFHPNCRHDWDAVPESEMEEAEEAA